LSKEGHLKVTDFGTSKIFPDTDAGVQASAAESEGKDTESKDARAKRRNSFVGTPEYMPPEMIHNYPGKGPVSDLWSLGIIIYQLLVGKVPFHGGSAYLTMKKVDKHDIFWPPDFDTDARDLIENLLHKEPTLRLGCKERGGFPILRKHPFFAGIDFATVHFLAVPGFPVPAVPQPRKAAEPALRVEAADLEEEEESDKEPSEVRLEDLDPSSSELIPIS